MADWKIPDIMLEDGNEIPQLGLGTWQLKGQACKDAVREAFRLGYRHIDTAQIYGNEDVIGEMLDEIPREELFITSKAWWTNLNYENLIRACERSLEMLTTGYLDLYLVHWPREEHDMDEIFKAFKYLQEEGKIVSVGVSNYTVSHLNEALPLAKKHGVQIAVNQVEFHPRLYQKRLLDFCEEYGIVITGYSPLARTKILDEKILQDIGEKHKKSAAQVALRWAVQKGIVVIPKASSREHLRENMEIFDFELTQEQAERIDRIKGTDRMIEPVFSEFEKART